MKHTKPGAVPGFAESFNLRNGSRSTITAAQTFAPLTYLK
jgi:hypothetical protein